MGKPLASRLLKHFDNDELREITRSVTELGSVSMPVLETTIEEFAAQFIHGSGIVSSAAEAQELLSGVLSPEEISDIMSDVTGNSNHTIWERLSGVQEVIFSSYLIKEHPQTAAIILSRVTPACAAKVMAQLPREVRNELMRRMVGIAMVMEPATRLLESILQEDLLVNVARNNRSGHNVRMANIINKMERAQMEDVLSSSWGSAPESGRDATQLAVHVRRPRKAAAQIAACPLRFDPDRTYRLGLERHRLRASAT